MNLLNVPEAMRDTNWERDFLGQFRLARLNILSDEPQYGPDGFPYLLTGIAEAAVVATADNSTVATIATVANKGEAAATREGESVIEVVQWLVEHGVGLVLNPHREYPDFVFTYGMLWNFTERGEFVTENPSQPLGAIDLRPGQQLWTGVPTEKYLPGYVRQFVKQFLLDHGVLRPRILLVGETQSHFDLAFSIESLGDPSSEEHAGIAEAISWFMPSHYSLALLSEKIVGGFVDL